MTLIELVRMREQSCRERSEDENLRRSDQFYELGMADAYAFVLKQLETEDYKNW